MRSHLALGIAAFLARAPLSAALYQNGSVIAPCDSPIYCYGDILKQIELARPFEDSKTFNNTALNEFLGKYFGKAGSELEAISPDLLETQPDFLSNVNSSTVSDFISQVIDIWPDLTRRYVGAGNCSGCVTSFIPVNRTFVVAGGRFREPYYWDSFWIVEGLLRTKGSFTEIAYNIIENFLDLVDLYGFVPNGARRYYLNRSQPPLLTQMVRVYLEHTQNTTMLKRALPLLEKEYNFFAQNRTVQVERGGKNYSLSHYAVSNNQPRPESYYEDYQTATNQSYYNKEGEIFNSTRSLNETELATLYANLASGAESGWDYSSRWLKNPSDAVTDTYFPLRSLNTMNILPVDLNSILYYNEITIAGFYRQLGNYSASSAWAKLAKARSEAMTALMWDDEHYSYFDYNMASGAKNIYVLADDTSTEADLAGAPAGYQVEFSAAQFYPFWTGAATASIKKDPAAILRAYSRVAASLDDKAGAISATNLLTGQQWDEPNVWPPLQYILIQGLINTPLELDEDSDDSTADDYAQTQELALKLAQRYLDSAFCTWRDTGGSTPDFPKIEGLPEGQNGIIFEKYNDNATNAVGGGGEYAVVEGFGWSNGVLIWAADVFGQRLQTPECGDLKPAQSKKIRKKSAVDLSSRDAQWVKNFKS
ncbi:Six-hairpin glycosidase-like protein [Clohesyomyces aquaticus]|uniref:Trehalase n=1 Tax=Clohesyomyces aquaticus TaxID=1231657 RepID=A0A1Y1ZFZ1_9PLEO|nr:Six-hairpin glycosidase-like protein [Clohesyomyces aquaticus]